MAKYVAEFSGCLFVYYALGHNLSRPFELLNCVTILVFIASFTSVVPHYKIADHRHEWFLHQLTDPVQPGLFYKLPRHSFINSVTHPNPKAVIGSKAVACNLDVSYTQMNCNLVVSCVYTDKHFYFLFSATFSFSPSEYSV